MNLVSGAVTFETTSRNSRFVPLSFLVPKVSKSLDLRTVGSTLRKLLLLFRLNLLIVKTQVMEFQIRKHKISFSLKWYWIVENDQLQYTVKTFKLFLMPKVSKSLDLSTVGSTLRKLLLLFRLRLLIVETQVMEFQIRKHEISFILNVWL